MKRRAKNNNLKESYWGDLKAIAYRNIEEDSLKRKA